jgi:hypothetical protein
MKKSIYFLVCLAGGMLISLTSYSQLSHEFDWAKQIMPIGGAEMPRDIFTDNSGNIISTGNFSLSYDFDPGPGTYYLTSQTYQEREIFVQKMDPDGNLLWAQQFGANTGELADMGTSVITDAADNIYLAGKFWGTVNFGALTLTSLDGSDGFIMKMSPDGTVLWVKQLARMGDMGVWSCTLRLGGDGYLYAAGDYAGTLDADPGPNEVWLTSGTSYLIRLDAEGNYSWSGSIGGSCMTLAVNANTSNWEMYLGGGFGGTADFDPGPGVYNLTEYANGDAYLLKVVNGQFSWAKKYGVTGIDEVRGIWYHSDGYLYTGKYYGLYYAKTSLEIQKLNPANGNAVWTDIVKGAKTTDVITGGQLCMDAAGNLCVSCYYRGTIDFDPGSGTYNMTNPASNDGNPCILKLKNNGAFEWVFEQKVNCCSDVRGFCMDASENIFSLGQHSLPVECDPGTGTYYIEPGNGGTLFIHKLRKTGLLGCRPPAAIQALNIEQNSAAITWINTSGGSSFDIQYRTYGSTEWTTVSSISSGYILTGLSAGNTYEYQLRSICGGTSGSWSTLCWFKTIVEGCINTGEPNNTLATATPISVSVPVTGLISSFTDVDWYKFNNTSTQKKINLTLYNLPAPFKMELVKSSGTVLATSTTMDDGSESIVYTKGTAGAYYIRVFGNKGHYNQSECYSLLATIYKSAEADPIEEVADETALKLYPNPASTLLNVEFNSLIEGAVTMRLLDMTGRLQWQFETKAVQGDNNFTISHENLPNGLYLFGIAQGDYREMKKVVINR